MVAVKVPNLVKSMENIAIPRLSVVVEYVFPLTVKVTLAPFTGLSDFDFNVATTFFALDVVNISSGTVNLVCSRTILMVFVILVS